MDLLLFKVFRKKLFLCLRSHSDVGNGFWSRRCNAISNLKTLELCFYTSIWVDPILTRFPRFMTHVLVFSMPDSCGNNFLLHFLVHHINFFFPNSVWKKKIVQIFYVYTRYRNKERKISETLCDLIESIEKERRKT